MPSKVLILDYGSQYTQLIARRVRELGVYSEVMAGTASLERVLTSGAKAIILSGGPSSVYDLGAPNLPDGFLSEQEKLKIPVLGICYGLQLITRGLGGEVSKAKVREYGRMRLKYEKGELFPTLLSGVAWMSHGDEVSRLPEGFNVTARSEEGGIAAIECKSRRIYGLQFHPEVSHTERGIEILKRFIFDIALLKADWTMEGVIESETRKISEKMGSVNHAICALSGGVDSAVAAALVARAIGDRLHAVFVDHGLLRQNEREEVMTLFKDKLKLPVTCVDVSSRFFTALNGVTDPERKRKIIGSEFISVFEEYAQGLKSQLGEKPRFLIQGTLYPDVIESSPPPGALGAASMHSTTIKSHHNVGGLPEKMGFSLIEPLRDLFKDEVRALGQVLGVPPEFLSRHPFPGPGLAVRVLGDVTRERVSMLQAVDAVFIDEIRKAGIYDLIWQAFAVFLPIRSVGVQGDGRTHDHVVGLRAVTSSDGMTADWFRFDPDFLARVSSRICNEVKGVNRVVLDITSKPPATIEWE